MDDRLPWRGLLAGALFYAVVLWLAHGLSPAPYVGGFIYNYYFLSLIDGQLDIPLQIIGLEGHYTADGRAFVYHGLGPLLTRLLAYPFVDLTQTDLLAPTIWLFAVIGSGAFYFLLCRMLNLGRQAGLLSACLWGLVWITGPGLILVSNGSFYHEPIGMAYACLGVFLLCLWHLAEGDYGRRRIYITMAVLAALALLARPHVAVGMYLVMVCIAVGLLWRQRLRALPVLALSMGILLAAGVGYMAMNAIRFGGVTALDGSPLQDVRAVYGFVYWGMEVVDSPRYVAAAEYGRFYPPRILLNGINYFLATSEALAVNLTAAWQETLGHIRIERPVAPLALLWPLWVGFAGYGVLHRGLPRPFSLLMLIATLPMAVLILSYPTVTMRYRIELWPVIFVLGAGGMAAFGGALRERDGFRHRLYGGVALCLGGVLSLQGAYQYAHGVNWRWGGMLRAYEDCAVAVSAHPDLGVAQVDRLCVIDAPSAAGQ